MLTLREPIQLHTAQPLCSCAESFGQRIIGNYGLLGARYEAKDLLFLMTAPPTSPEEPSGMTNIVVDQSAQNQTNITMDVVNHVVNRIMLDGSTQFTYQDQVYITSVLNRMGITDVAQFMAEVRRLRVESQNMLHMNSLYVKELQTILLRQSLQPDVPLLPLHTAPADTDAAAKAEDPRVTLALQILDRLQTTRIYDTVHAFQNDRVQAQNIFRSNTLRLTEQYRQSREVRLAETKKQIFDRTDLTLAQHWNRYEHMNLAEPAQTSEQVIAQAAAAALLHVVDNSMIEVLARPELKNQWIQIQNALWQTAEHTIERFETYHSAEHLSTTRQLPSAEVTLLRYEQERSDYTLLYRNNHPQEIYEFSESDTVLLPMEMPLPAVNVTQQELFRQWNHYITEEQQFSGHSVEKLLLRELLRREASFVLPKSALRPVQERLTKEHPIRLLHVPSVSEEPLVPTAAEQTVVHALLTRLLAHDRQQTIVLRQRDHRTQQSLHHVTESATHSELQTVVREIFDIGQETIRTQTHTDGTAIAALQAVAPPSSPALQYLTAEQAEQQAPELLLERLQQIDRQNRISLQTVQQHIQQTQQLSAPKPVMPDVKRTMRDALRSLEDPMQVLHEIAMLPPPKQREHSYTPEEQALLSQAAPQDKALYEAIIAYRHDPEEAVRRGMLQPAALGTLQAELYHAPKPQELPETERPDEQLLRQTAYLREHSETVLERIAHLPPTVVRSDTVTPKPQVRFVHKQMQPEVTEEMLQELRGQVQTTKVEDRVQKTFTNIHTVDTQQIQKETVTQTTQDITELVNRTLAREMRTITDQVYRRMERKLMEERSRRGRM